MKVLFDFLRQQIVIDGEPAHLLEVLAKVQEIAPSLTKIEINTAADRTGASPATPASPPRPMGTTYVAEPLMPPNGSPVRTGQTARQFARKLPANNAYERIAVVAYYMMHFEGRTLFSPKDMDEWFGICGFQKPSQMPVAFSDARRKYGYIESTGRAQWRLSTGGENLVIGMLNVQEASQQQS